MYMSPYRLLILLGAIGDFIRILIFYSTQESYSAGISIYNKKFISGFFCEDFLDSLFKMEKKRTKVATPLFEKTV